MKNYLVHDPWKVIEEGFHPQNNRVTESIFSLGNGLLGGRGNFEEHYSGDTLQGQYVAGLYYPDKTRVGWWKNGYPKYYAKVLNATNWIGIDILIGDNQLDLNDVSEIIHFNRQLDMRRGLLTRSFQIKMKDGKELKVSTTRFLSMVKQEVGAIRYSLTALNFSGKITFIPSLDGDIKNEDSNYDIKFWNEVKKESTKESGTLEIATKKTNFHLASSMRWSLSKNEGIECKAISREKYVANQIRVWAQEGKEIVICKFVSQLSSMNHPLGTIFTKAQDMACSAMKAGFDNLLNEHVEAWALKWKEGDICIEGDIIAQQGIRFNIFHLFQTYTGKDDRLNIGPKGFTGEKYGGATYWDTEAYCLPFFLKSSDPQVARNLLIYRYKHLQKAIENANKLGFSAGAALYPMVTMDGEECHNEWEITFEEIHRNGAIAYAIFNYIRYTNDWPYLAQYGLEVLLALSRFWIQRVTYSPKKDCFFILGVTGPNEYENNVNNNWYTNTMAAWTLEYTLEAINYVLENHLSDYKRISKKTNFNEKDEIANFKEIIQKMYFPVDDENNIFLQQDGYMDKEQKMAYDLKPSEQPLHQHWSWDRILRSCFIKQADVLQGLYFLEHRFDLETIKRNFSFYEPRTVHESSLSPCVHTILAAKIGKAQKAYEMYLRTARLDLDDYNNDTEDGLHITSMAGTVTALVEGLGGVRIKNNQLSVSPIIPNNWKSYSFKILFRKKILRVTIQKDGKYSLREE